MDKFVPRNKMGKKARKELDAKQRSTWAFSPATKKLDSKKIYNRKRISRNRMDGPGDFLYALSFFTRYSFAHSHTNEANTPTAGLASLSFGIARAMVRAAGGSSGRRATVWVLPSSKSSGTMLMPRPFSTMAIRA